MSDEAGRLIVELFRRALDESYSLAESMYESGDISMLQEMLGDSFQMVLELARARHAARGIVLTLATYKTIQPHQDIRRHKADFEGGFSARGIDTAVTVPFLRDHDLQRSVETHWLTQTFSFAGPLESNVVLNTNPKFVGPSAVTIVNDIERADTVDFARAVTTLILCEMIDIRNKGRVLLTKPKNLSINQVLKLLQRHFMYGYKKNTPRLPQLAIFALYECLMDTVGRYRSYQLRPLERMKTANRKSGSVGDIDVEFNDQPVEAVEVKYEQLITLQHVEEVIEKIKTASVERYFILSTGGISEEDKDAILSLQEDFRRSNGCEIVVNGVYSTIAYYLRILRSTNDFINRYTTLVEVDEDVDYEHRLAWNELCS